MRSSLLDEMGSDYLTTARAKGLRDDLVRRRHAVPNALLPTVTLVFINLGGMVAGAILVETVFSWPGLGGLFYQALSVPDLPLVQGLFFVFAGRGDPDEHARRPGLSAARPPGGPMTTPADASASPRAAGAGHAAGAPSPRSGGEYRTHRAGLSAWPRSRSSRCCRAGRAAVRRRDVSQRDRAPRARRGSARAGEFPLGTDQFGRSLLGLLMLGLAGLAARRAARGPAVGGHRHPGRHRRRALQRLVRDRADADHRLVPGACRRWCWRSSLATVMSRSRRTIVLAIGVTSWPTTARLVRAQTLAVESRPYIERAKALGGGHWHIMTRHVLPNVMPLVLAQTTLLVSTAILAEATLAFLGLGDPHGRLLGRHAPGRARGGRGQRRATGGTWCRPASPSPLVALAFTLCGRALESVLNPRRWGAVSR